MAKPTQQETRRSDDYVVALTRLFIEAFNARDYEAVRALVSDDVEVRGPNGSSLRGHPAASELLETAGHLDLLVVRTALEEVEPDDGGVRVNVPIRELARREELFRTAVFRVREGAITSFETLGMD
jgi:ketosteroid isomerase-like protein